MGKLEGKTVLITGASAGIGEAVARLFAKEGAALILAARRLERVKQLAVECSNVGNPESFAVELDVRDHDAVKDYIEGLPENRVPHILVNNAGLSRGLEPVHEGLISDWEEMIDTNVKGLLYVSRYMLPRMLKAGRGHVVNIGSISGHEVYPGGAVYCGTKFAVHAISKGMRIELMGTPIRVSLVAPGMVNTEFSTVRFHGDYDRGQQTYDGVKPLMAEDVAEAILYAVGTPEHVNVDEVLVMPRQQAGVAFCDRSGAQ